MPQEPRRGSNHSVTLAGRVRNFANHYRPAIDVHLDDPNDTEPSGHGRRDSYVHSYSTGDEIKGTLNIAGPIDRDAPFDDIEIAFVGKARTHTDTVTPTPSSPGRSVAFHEFLKLIQPLEECNPPEPRILKAGQHYELPFAFVVPKQLLPTTCSHTSTSQKLTDAHLQLPPSLGDKDVAGKGNQLLDDLAPTMAQVSYGVRVRISRNRDTDDKPIIVSDRTKKVRILPQVDEQPPVNVDGLDEEYCQRQEKSVKKGVFKGKTGRIAIEAAQPASLSLHHPAQKDNLSVTTKATVMVRFDPKDANASPPKLGRLSTKLKVATFFANSARVQFPAKKHVGYDHTQGLFVEVVTLSSRNMQGAQWQKHDPGADAPHTPPYQEFDTPNASTLYYPRPTKQSNPQLPFWTTELVVPINLPKHKAFVPTFHSCLISRIYVLDLNLALSSSPTPANVTLKLPVQLSSSGSMASRQSSFAGTGELIEDSAPTPESPYFEPRRTADHESSESEDEDEDERQGINALPPEYSPFPTRSGRSIGSHRGLIHRSIPRFVS